MLTDDAYGMVWKIQGKTDDMRPGKFVIRENGNTEVLECIVYVNVYSCE